MEHGCTCGRIKIDCLYKKSSILGAYKSESPANETNKQNKHHTWIDVAACENKEEENSKSHNKHDCTHKG